MVTKRLLPIMFSWPVNFSWAWVSWHMYNYNRGSSMEGRLEILHEVMEAENDK
jgi:hypothetical protein